MADFSRFSVGPLQAPRGHGEVLARPELSDWNTLAIANRQRLDQSAIRIADRPLAGFREWTRRCLIAEADRFTVELIPDADAPVAAGVQGTPGPVFVAGHQPVLAHPGVWAKNIAIAEAARAADGCSLNLIVDNDLVERASVDVPAGNADDPWYSPIPFDAPPRRQPWEELAVADEPLFRSFADRLVEALAPWNVKPVIASVWPAVVERLHAIRSTSHLLTLVRVLLQRRWGAAGGELPISRLCETEPFACFVLELCRDAERFREVHNAALAEYRAESGIRNDRHPVPPLESHNGWTELPLWVWRAGDSRRQHLLARFDRGTIELSNAEQSLGRIGPLEGDCGDAPTRQIQQIQQTWRLRPRALTTTIFARLCISDLFVHGIGGAKYDEVTDRILERFFGITPPAYGVLTATMHLPLPSFDVTDQTLHELVRKMRDMEFNPHRYLDDSAAASANGRREALLAEKKRLRNLPRSKREWRDLRPQRRQIHQQLTAIREDLAGETTLLRRSVLSEMDTVRRRLAANRILRSREYAAILYPEREVEQLLAGIRGRLPTGQRT